MCIYTYVCVYIYIYTHTIVCLLCCSFYFKQVFPDQQLQHLAIRSMRHDVMHRKRRSIRVTDKV